MRQWVQDWGPVLTLLATLGLLGVTTWYAILTRRVAEASASAASHAQSAAEASRAAAAAAEAAAEVEFTLAPALTSTAGRLREFLAVQTDQGRSHLDQEVTLNILAPLLRFTGVTVRCAGVTVYVHGLRLDGVAYFQDDDRRITAGVSEATELVSGQQLPCRLHKNESMRLTMSDERPSHNLAKIDATIRYAFDAGAGVPYERKISWDASSR